jgi:hypothetical protein
VWVPGKIALIAVVCGAGALAACSGPLDSPTPRPPLARDAGVDFRRDVASDRGTDVADRGPTPRDASVEVGFDSPPRIDLGVDLRADLRLDLGLDLGVDAPAPWPVLFGCVTGLPPLPDMLITGGQVSPLVVGCAGLSRTIATLYDRTRSGFIFTARFDPPLDGFEVSPSRGAVCSDGQGVSIIVTAPDSQRHPGFSGTVSLVIAVEGPSAPVFLLRLPVSVVTTDFSLASEVIDFGRIPFGTGRTTEVVVTNAPSSAPIQTLYTSPQAAGPFSLESRPMDGEFPSPLEPGETGPMLTSFFLPTTIGTFTSTFLVSPFVPGVSIDPLCGGVRMLTLTGQVYAPSRDGGPIP